MNQPFGLNLEEAEALAREIKQRRKQQAVDDEHRRPELLRREDAIVVLHDALEVARKSPCSHQPPIAGTDTPTH